MVSGVAHLFTATLLKCTLQHQRRQLFVLFLSWLLLPNHEKNRESGRSPLPRDFLGTPCWKKRLGDAHRATGWAARAAVRDCSTAEMGKQAEPFHHLCKRLFWKPRKLLNLKADFQRKTNLKTSPFPNAVRNKKQI